MNQQQVEQKIEDNKDYIVFAYAEYPMRNWLSYVLESGSALQLFGGDCTPLQKLYIKATTEWQNPEGDLFYELSLKMVPHHTVMDYSGYEQFVYNAIGFLLYAAREVYPPLIATAATKLTDYGIHLDDQTHHLYIQYVPELVKRYDELCKKTANKTPDADVQFELAQLSQQLSLLQPEIERRNAELFCKQHLVVGIDKVREKDIPPEFNEFSKQFF